MGCDIHLRVERRVNGKWEPADKWVPTKYPEEEGPSFVVDYDDRFYSGRNYNLFAILADVRNGRGFAGVKTSEGFVPICEPKGIPDDITDLVRADYESWGSDAHSASWHTVSDLMAYDWTQCTILRGCLDGWTYAQWCNYPRTQGESPKEWSGAVWGHTIVHLTDEEAKSKLEAITGGARVWEFESQIRDEFKDTYINCEWTQFYYECTGKFLQETMPKLWQLGNPEDVRIVFWFDN